jgi:hypothetical protein
MLAVQEFSHGGPAQLREAGHRPARHPSCPLTLLVHQQIHESATAKSGTIKLVLRGSLWHVRWDAREATLLKPFGNVFDTVHCADRYGCLF